MNILSPIKSRTAWKVNNQLLRRQPRVIHATILAREVPTTNEERIIII